MFFVNSSLMDRLQEDCVVQQPMTSLTWPWFPANGGRHLKPPFSWKPWPGQLTFYVERRPTASICFYFLFWHKLFVWILVDSFLVLDLDLKNSANLPGGQYIGVVFSTCHLCLLAKWWQNCILESRLETTSCPRF